MSLKAYNIDVPITPGVMPPVIHIGQYDSGRDYICHLKNDDGTDYTIPSGTTATFTGCNPRKEVFELEATVDTSANTITITPKDEATSMFGKYGATLNLKLNDEQMSPIVILMDVQKAGATDDEIAHAANFPDAVNQAVDDWLEENIDEGQLGSLYIPQAAQAEKSTEMTQPVGIDGNGKLWTTPGEGGGSTEGAVRYDQSQSLSSSQKSQARTNIGAGTYSKPSGGIPATDMAQAVQNALTAAATAVQPSALASYVPRAQQAAKVSNQTQAVGIDANGKLWVQPPGSGGGAEIYYVNITASGNGYVSDKTFAEISAADAAGNLIVPRYNYFEGRMVKLTDEYAALSIIDLAIPEIPILRTFTVTASGTTGTGIDIGGAAYIYLVKNGDDYDIDTTNTPAILQTRGNVLNYFYDGIAVKLMYNGYAHPLVYHYGDGILKFGGAEYTVVNSHHVQQDVVYTWSASSHVAREVVTPLNTDLLVEKTSAMTQSVGYRASDGTLWTEPGSGGPEIPTPTSSDNGKYLKVVNGAYALGSAPSGGGVSIYSVSLVYRTGYWYIQHDGSDIAAEDIFTALNGGDLVQVTDDAGAECELMEINYSPDEGRLVYKSCNMDNGPPEWRIFTIQDEIVQGAPRADVTMTQVDLLPLSDSRTASQVASGFTVDGNTIYTVSGTISGFALSTNALPTMLPGQCIEIQFTVGSTAITTATWPSWCKKMNGWDGNFSANTYYDIVIDDAGNVYHSTREVSA